MRKNPKSSEYTNYTKKLQIFELYKILYKNNIFQIHTLPMEVQSNLLYRHAIFEIVALSVSVYISYEIYRELYDYLHNSIKPSKKTYMKIILTYVIVVVLTLVGACLEGTVNV